MSPRRKAEKTPEVMPPSVADIIDRRASNLLEGFTTSGAEVAGVLLLAAFEIRRLGALVDKYKSWGHKPDDEPAAAVPAQEKPPRRKRGTPAAPPTEGGTP